MCCSTAKPACSDLTRAFICHTIETFVILPSAMSPFPPHLFDCFEKSGGRFFVIATRRLFSSQVTRSHFRAGQGRTGPSLPGHPETYPL